MSARTEGIEEEDLRRLYEDEGMSQEEIGKWYGVSPQTIGRRMREYGIDTGFRRYDINEAFFKDWTKESAWVYMWVLGDGWTLRNSRFGFQLGRKDKEVLYKFKKVMDSEHPVTDQRFRNMSDLQIGSMEMVKDLRKLSYEDIPEWHRSHGIRGFFEAEGSVFLIVNKWRNKEYVGTNFSQKDTGVLEWIWEVLREERVVEGGSLNQNRRDDGWVLHFGEADSVSLYHYLYDDCGELYLQRKKDTFERLMAYRGYL